jgi:hypothetical protein
MDGAGPARHSAEGRHPAGDDRGTGAPRPPADHWSQVEASKARLVSSRNLCRNSETLISESRATIARSRKRLTSDAEVHIKPG